MGHMPALPPGEARDEELLSRRNVSVMVLYGFLLTLGVAAVIAFTPRIVSAFGADGLEALLITIVVDVGAIGAAFALLIANLDDADAVYIIGFIDRRHQRRHHLAIKDEERAGELKRLRQPTDPHGPGAIAAERKEE